MNAALIEKIKAIRLLILDVDGILTNGLLYYGNDGIELKAFHIHDGLGIKLLQRADIPVAIISAKSSEALKRRCKDLGIQHAYLGCEDKLPAYAALKQQFHLTDAAIAYMGDDLPDLPVLQQAGVAITVPNAPTYIQAAADHISTRIGGDGAVREICELILTSQNKLTSVLEAYLAEKRECNVK